MKRILLVVPSLLILSATPSFSQDENCTVDEQILLRERPYNLSEREALAVIRNKKSEAKLNTISYEVPVSVFPFKNVDSLYQRSAILVQNKDSILPNWRTMKKLVFVSPPTSDDDYWKTIIITVIVTFLLCFAIFKDALGNWSYEISKLYLTSGICMSVIIGFIACMMYGDGVDEERSEAYIVLVLYGLLMLLPIAVFFLHMLIFKRIAGYIHGYRKRRRMAVI